MSVRHKQYQKDKIDMMDYLFYTNSSPVPTYPYMNCYWCEHLFECCCSFKIYFDDMIQNKIMQHYISC